MTYKTLLLDNREAVCHITLNRPRELNALSLTLLTELRQILEQAAADPATRAILISASGRAFSSGADLKEAAERPEVDTYEALTRYYNPVVMLMRDTPKPVIAAVQGLAVGAGCNIALAADMVIAGKAAVFQQIFTSIALVPDAGGSYMLPRLIGKAKAMGAALSGGPVSAEQAEAWGMIWSVVDDNALAGEAWSLATTMAQRPTRALGLTKALINAAAENDLPTQLEQEAQTQREAQQSQDFHEAIEAFMNKRSPRFTGQ